MLDSGKCGLVPSGCMVRLRTFKQVSVCTGRFMPEEIIYYFF